MIGALAALLLSVVAADAASAKRIKVTGEIFDTWCHITEIMYAPGIDYHRCAIWCAASEIPVSIAANDGNTYMVFKVEGDGTNMANPAFFQNSDPRSRR